MLSRIELYDISETRLKEAKILFNNDLYDGAKYLLGYSLETGLKARICKILNSDYPERGELKKVFFTHRFDLLVVLAGIEKDLDRKKFDDPNFAVNWSLLADNWSEELRYEKIGVATKPELERLFDALENNQNGILTWLKTIW